MNIKYFFLFLLMTQLQSRELDVIYDIDNRQNINNVNDTRRVLSNNVALNVWNYSIQSGRIKGSFHGIKRNLCPEERFFNELEIGKCTGFLIAPKLLVTAKHCVRRIGDCLYKKWVFGYTNESLIEASSLISSGENIYNCIAEKRPSDFNHDVTILELDRPMDNFIPMSFGEVSAGDSLFSIAHPSGLPQKLADDAIVLNIDEFIHSNLDLSSGASGAPVFNEQNELIGVYLAGKTDYIYDLARDCYSSNILSSNSLNAEKILPIRYVKELLAQ